MAIARASRIVVVRIKDRLVGLLVDGASQVLKVPVSTIEAAPAATPQDGNGREREQRHRERGDHPEGLRKARSGNQWAKHQRAGQQEECEHAADANEV